MRAAQDTTGDKRPFTHDRIDLAENTPRELYSLLALYVGSPKKESFSERPNIQWVYVWRVYWAEIFEWEAKRPCLLLLDLEYTSNTVNMGGWMGTCVIAADMLNEGYQSVEVWQEEKVRRGERREEREPEKRRWKTSPKESDREKKTRGTGRYEQVGGFSSNRPQKCFHYGGSMVDAPCLCLSS